MRTVIGLLVLFWVAAPLSAAPEFNFDKGLTLRDSERDFYLQLNGRLQVDYINAAREDETLVNDAGIRRSWLTLSGQRGDWYFLSRFYVDREEGDRPEEQFIEYRGWGDALRLSVGRHKEPFGLMWRTSNKFLSLPERSAISDRYTFGHSVGVMASGDGPWLGYQVGIFEDGEGDKEASRLAVTGRLYRGFALSERSVLHLGAGASHRHAEQAYGLELAAVLGRFHLASEWLRSEPELGDPSSGSYLESGWFLTGDQMRYAKGVFGAVAPRGEHGAWQLVLRWDEGDGDYADMQLGEGDGRAVAFGLNWFANSHLRLGGSYSIAELAEQEGEELHLRLQFVF